MIRLADNLSSTVGEPTRLFFGNDGPWVKRSDQYGGWVTDGPYLYKSKSGKLFMIWSSGGATGYATGIAISDSGKLQGPWRHVRRSELVGCAQSFASAPSLQRSPERPRGTGGACHLAP
jgi:hypothetical protein